MHVHIALYKWRQGISQAQIAQVFSGIEALAPKIPGIIAISTAKNTAKYGQGYTHVIFVRGESQAAIDAYRAHPDHISVAEELDAMEEHGIGIDFETA